MVPNLSTKARLQKLRCRSIQRKTKSDIHSYPSAQGAVLFYFLRIISIPPYFCRKTCQFRFLEKVSAVDQKASAWIMGHGKRMFPFVIGKLVLFSSTESVLFSANLMEMTQLRTFQTQAAFDLATRTTRIAVFPLALKIDQPIKKTEFSDAGCSGCQIEHGHTLYLSAALLTFCVIGVDCVYRDMETGCT